MTDTVDKTRQRRRRVSAGACFLSIYLRINSRLRSPEAHTQTITAPPPGITGDRVLRSRLLGSLISTPVARYSIRYKSAHLSGGRALMMLASIDSMRASTPRLKLRITYLRPAQRATVTP
jgi:hypothetical protein